MQSHRITDHQFPSITPKVNTDYRCNNDNKPLHHSKIVDEGKESGILISQPTVMIFKVKHGGNPIEGGFGAGKKLGNYFEKFFVYTVAHGGNDDGKHRNRKQHYSEYQRAQKNFQNEHNGLYIGNR